MTKLADVMNEYNPDVVTSPHLTILETMEADYIDRETFALMMVPVLEPEQTEALLKGKLVITEEVAVQLEVALGVPAQFWLNREKRHVEYLRIKHPLSPIC